MRGAAFALALLGSLGGGIPVATVAESERRYDPPVSLDPRKGDRLPEPEWEPVRGKVCPRCDGTRIARRDAAGRTVPGHRCPECRRR